MVKGSEPLRQFRFLYPLLRSWKFVISVVSFLLYALYRHFFTTLQSWQNVSGPTVQVKRGICLESQKCSENKEKLPWGSAGVLLFQEGPEGQEKDDSWCRCGFSRCVPSLVCRNQRRNVYRNEINVYRNVFSRNTKTRCFASKTAGFAL